MKKSKKQRAISTTVFFLFIRVRFRLILLDGINDENVSDQWRRKNIFVCHTCIAMSNHQ
jgi:hypothetical protein